MDYRSNADAIARKSTRIILLLYTVLKLLLALPEHTHEPAYIINRALACVAIAALTYTVTKLKLSNWLTPLLVTISAALPELIWVAFAARGDWEIYIFMIGCSLVSMLYLDRLGLLLSMLFSCSSLALFSFVLKVTLTGWAANEDIYGFFAVVLANILIFFICQYSVGGYTKFWRIGRLFEVVMDTTPNYAAVVNEQAKVEYVSKSVIKLLGIEKQEYAAGMPFIDLFPSGDLKLIFGEFMRREGSIEDTFEVEIDGRPRWYILRSALLNQSQAARFFEWMDITPIIEAQKTAESAARAKSDFLAKMSHEIRTPMNAVMGMSELILRKELPQDVYENALMIKNASANLLSIINDILDFSKIESGKLEIIETDYIFSSLVNDIVSIVKVRLAEKPICFIVDIAPHIPLNLIGDEVRIRQILINLMSNAVKYTHEGRITLTITGDVSDSAVGLSIRISDTGVGIKSEHIDKLFGDFIQIDTLANKGIEGTGLGLAISRNLCRAMGGDITVQSVYGEGSVFTVSLPQRFREYKPFAAVKALDKSSVLIYETRTDYRDSIIASLNALGVTCKSAENIPALFEAMEAYDFVFIASFMYGSINPTLSKPAKVPKLTLLADVTETLAPQDVRILHLPAHTLSIANILNDVYEDLQDQHSTDFNFIAPDAQVLIVDDVTANLKVAEGLLLPFEMQITLCSSGEKALKLVSENFYDLVFMDHMMPDMDGIETTRRIRAMEGDYFQTLPIIALTANAVSGMREMFIQNGLNDFLAKPIETIKLSELLDKWIPKPKRKKPNAPAKPAEKSDLLDRLQSNPELSIAKALSILGGSAETYARILKLSIRLLPENIAHLNHLIDTDLPAYAIEVHGVKGVLNNIGAYELGDAALELETLSQKGEQEACEALHPALNERLTRFYDSMAFMLGDDDALAKEKGSEDFLSDTLEKLLGAAEYYDSALALDLLTSAAAYTFGQAFDKDLAELTRAFEHFDFDLAAEEIARIQANLAQQP